MGDSELSTKLLHFILENGNMDIPLVQDVVVDMKREQILKEHKYTVWQSADGKWHTYLPDEKKGRLHRKRQTKKEIEDIIVAFYEDNSTFKSVFEEWIEEKLKYKELQKQSFDRYYTDFIRFFTNNKDATKILSKKFKNITEEDLEEFIKLTVANMGLTSKSLAGLKTIVRGVFSYGKRKKYTTLSITNFMGDLTLSKNALRKVVKDKRMEIFQLDEIETITQNLRSRTEDVRSLGLLLLFETGMRVGELAALKTTDIDDDTIHVQRTEIKIKDVDGKSRLTVKDYPKTEAGNRYIIMNDGAKATIEMLLKLNNNYTFLFADTKKPTRITSTDFRRKLRQVCRDLDIAYRSNHKIRRSYGTMLIDSKIDESLVAEQMGHSDISVTKKYYYYSNKSFDEKVKQINNAINI